jgi:hypothetical protein
MKMERPLQALAREQEQDLFTRLFPPNEVAAAVEVAGGQQAKASSSQITNSRQQLEMLRGDMFPPSQTGNGPNDVMLQYKIVALEQKVQEKHTKCNRVKAQLGQLEQDLKYNLQSVKTKDDELEKYRNLFIQARNRDVNKAAKVRELEMRCTDAEMSARQQEASADEAKMWSRAQVELVKKEYEAVRSALEQERARRKAEKQQTKVGMESVLREERSKLDAQRREVELQVKETLLKQSRKHAKKLLEVREAVGGAQRENSELKVALEQERSARLRERDQRQSAIAGEREMQLERARGETAASQQRYMSVASKLEVSTKALRGAEQHIAKQKKKYTAMLAHLTESKAEVELQSEAKYGQLEVKYEQLESKCERMRVSMEGTRVAMQVRNPPRNTHTLICTLAHTGSHWLTLTWFPAHRTILPPYRWRTRTPIESELV